MDPFRTAGGDAPPFKRQAPGFQPFSDEQLCDLEAKVGPIAVFTAKARARPRWAKGDATPPEPPYQVVYRTANPGEYKTFRSQANNERTKAAAQEMLARATVVGVSTADGQTLHDGQLRGPSERAVREAFDGLLMKWPGAAEAAGTLLLEHNGLAQDEAEKG